MGWTAVVPDSGVLWWWAFAVAVVAALLVTPLAPAAGEDLRVSVCRSTGGSCGYVAPRTRCAVLSRDAGIASAVTPLRVNGSDGSDVVTTKLLDGSATVTLHDPPHVDLSGLAAARLALRPTSGGAIGDPPGLDAVYRFGRHDDADAWLDHYRRVDAPVSSAVAGWTSAAPASGARAAVQDGLHDGVRRLVRLLGFSDLDSVREPDGVVVPVPVEAVTSAAYGRATSSGTGEVGDGSPGQTATRLTLDADGRSSTAGVLPAAGTQDELERALPQALGFDGPATYRVVSDAGHVPVRLELTGAAAIDADGDLVAAQRIANLREGGESRSSLAPGAMQTLVLDLRAAANREAFDRLFRVAGPVATVRAVPLATTAAGTVAPDDDSQAEAVQLLAGRLADDAVYVRTAVATRGSETTLLDGFSEDLAVPASRLTAMPGCVQ